MGLLLVGAVGAGVPTQSGSVTDLTGRLKRDAARWAEANCELLMARKQVRLAVLLTPRAGPGGASELARETHAGWGLGERGMLIVLGAASHEVGFHAGKAIAVRFPRAETDAMLLRAAQVALRADDSAGAVMAGVAAVLSSNGLVPTDSVFAPQSAGRKSRKGAPLFTLAAVILFLAGLVAIDPDWRALVTRRKP